MKALVVYESQYGNTEKIAKAIGDAVGAARVARPGEVNTSELESTDLVIVGSPTQAGRSVKAIQEFLASIPADGLKNKRVASFDTRFKTWLVKLFGYAAGRIAKELKAKGGTLVAPGEGFFVSGTKGPLEDGELERAASWVKGIAGGQA